MFKDDLKDTIAAISTPQGEGGIGIVRLSGEKALTVTDKIFVSSEKGKPSGFKSHTVHYGRITDNGKMVDEVLLTVMRGPKSYTRQDIVEINCHGGLLSLRRILDLTVQHGCRLAGPGEFTRRAFLNGRIDLAQAEAVIDLIRAKTASALKVSLGQLEGGLSRRIGKIREGVMEILVILEANIDFPEEDIRGYDAEKISSGLHAAIRQMDILLEGSFGGRILREGLQAVICGKPNVGKSSLLNALLKKERSIVTPVAGTTRDTIEEAVDVRGIPVRLVDTAGILKPRNLIEKKAVKRSRERIASADLVILLFDAGRRIGLRDKELVRELKNRNVIAVINKIDLKAQIDKKEISGFFPRVVELAARTGRNLELLEEAIFDFACRGRALNPEHILLSNLRHIHALRDARGLLEEADRMLRGDSSLELITQDLKDACVYLDNILGKDFSAELLDKIFADFCIGK